MKLKRKLERKRGILVYARKCAGRKREKERKREIQEGQVNNKNIKERTNIHSHDVVPRVNPLVLGKGLAVLLELFVGALMITALLDESRAGIGSRFIFIAV